MAIKKRKPILIMTKAAKPASVKVEESKREVKSKVESIATPKPSVIVDKDAPKTPKVQVKVEVKPKAEPKPESKVEPKAEPKPEPKAEPKPAVSYKGFVKGSDPLLKKSLNVEAVSVIKFEASAGEIGACSYKVIANPTLQVSKAGLTSYPDNFILDKEIFCATKADADAMFNILKLSDNVLAAIEVDVKSGALINKKFLNPRELSKVAKRLGIGSEKVISTFTSWF